MDITWNIVFGSTYSGYSFANSVIHILLYFVDLGHGPLATNVSLIKANEVEDIFDGNDLQYKASSLSNSVDVSTTRYDALCTCITMTTLLVLRKRAYFVMPSHEKMQ